MYVGTLFDEDFTSPISMPGLTFQGAIKLRDIEGDSNMRHSEPITEETGPLHRNSESFPNITGLSYPTSEEFKEKRYYYQIMRGIDVLQDIHKKKMKQKVCPMKTV